MKLKDNILVVMRLEGRPMWSREIRDKLPSHSSIDYYEAMRDLYKEEEKIIIFDHGQGWIIKK